MDAKRLAHAVAPFWHTRLFVLVLLLAPATSLLGGRNAVAQWQQGSQVVTVYLPLLSVSVAFSAYVSGLGIGRNLLRELFGKPWLGPRQTLLDLTWALLLAIAVLGVDSVLQRLAMWPESLAAHSLLPQSVGAKACWLGLAACVGVAEELIYRGYLQRQLSALTGRVSLGIVAQALLFGIAHGEQGAFVVARFTAYAVAFGWVAERRQGLMAVTLCHVALDLHAGFCGAGVSS
jgi:membrane protease YdiL (CAAX protease family)